LIDVVMGSERALCQSTRNAGVGIARPFLRYRPRTTQSSRCTCLS
jgi:hypothetical protein